MRAGAKGIVPLAASAGAFGVGFGVLAHQGGLHLSETLLMSGLVFAGSAQMVCLQLWASPVPLAAVWLATLAMNSRYILMGATLRPWLGALSPLRAYGPLALMADGNWMLAMRERAAGRSDAGYFLGGGIVMYLSWFVATGAGHVLGGWLGPPQRLGLDFMLTAFCATLLTGLWRGKGDLAVAGVAAGTAVLVQRFVPGNWHILAGGLAGSLVGAWRNDDRA